MITIETISINDWRNCVFESELNASVKLVALAIARYWRPESLCYPSIATIMADCSIRSKHTVINAIKTLTEAGFIKIKKGQIKYLSAFQNFYELCGVVDGATNGAIDGASDGATNGAIDGAINAPEIREIREDNNLKKEKIYKKEKKFSKEFQVWWHEYPRKVAKVAAEKAFTHLLAEKKVSFEELLDGLKRYAEHCKQQNTEEQYIKHPATWLNQGCWADEYAQNTNKTNEPDFSWL